MVNPFNRLFKKIGYSLRRRKLRKLRKKQQKEYEKNKANSVYHQPYISPLLTTNPSPQNNLPIHINPNNLNISQPPHPPVSSNINGADSPVNLSKDPPTPQLQLLYSPSVLQQQQAQLNQQQQQQQENQISPRNNNNNKLKKSVDNQLNKPLPTTPLKSLTSPKQSSSTPSNLYPSLLNNNTSISTTTTTTTNSNSSKRLSTNIEETAAEIEDQLSDYKKLQRERYLKQKQERKPSTPSLISSSKQPISPRVKIKKSGGVFTKPVKMIETKYNEINFSSKDGCIWINDQRLRLKGINWFGCETETSVVHGLWQRDYKQYLEFLHSNHFNAIRIPFSLEMVLKDPFPTSISITPTMNTDMHGLRALSVLDVIIEAAGEKGMFVLLDLHSFGPNDRLHDGLWYNNLYSENDTLKAWNILILRYGRTWNVIGVDLKNEPYSATWNSGNHLTDWDKAINRIGTYIQTNGGQRWLIFGQGVQTQQNSTLPCCWGESFELEGRNGQTTISLPHMDKFVYSPHCYGPSVVSHSHFRSHTFPHNMPPHWDINFGLLPITTGRAVVVGEWGGRYNDNPDRMWMDTFVSYLQGKGCTDTFYWCLNPNSGDTGGLLQDDWVSINQEKLDLLHKLSPHPTSIQFDKDTRTFIVSSVSNSSTPANTSSGFLENI